MPRLKYHNPSVVMTMNRSIEPSEQPSLTVYFSNPSSSSASPEAASKPTGKSRIIDLRHKTDSQILTEFVQLTGATVLEPTAEDVELAQQLTEAKDKSETDRKRMLEVTRVRKREEEILRQARGEIE